MSSDSPQKKHVKLLVIIATGGAAIIAALVFSVLLSTSSVSQTEQRATFCQLAQSIYTNTLTSERQALALANDRNETVVIIASFRENLARLEELPCTYKEEK
jgi:hypothetical protein